GGLFDYRGLKWNLLDLSLGLRGRYQRSNAAVVLGALEIVRQDFPLTEAAVRKGLRTVFWPGRLEVVQHRPMVILDGAHNGEGVRALVDEIRRFHALKKVKLLFAAMEDKDWACMIRELSEVASEVVLTRVPMQRSAEPRKIGQVIGEKIPLVVIEDPAQALRFLLERAGPDDAILITGSLYLLGAVRPLLAERTFLKSSAGRLADVGA
ncbi:MAG: cyanophycin synthetase, partial [Candidatus Binatota bacterium]